jgi:beta-N-acetylhexosaminidase
VRQNTAVGEQTTLADRKRRAAQRLILGFEGTSVPEDIKQFCREAPPAGFILFARNVEEPAQVRELNRELASLLPDSLPPILSVDQEGGRVMRVRDTAWPPMRWLGNVNDLALTRQVGAGIGAELAAMGFNLDWAPVADVDSNPKNPVIGDRSFSRDPKRVAQHVGAFLDGLHTAGLMGCVKHFPGHGDTSVDSHLDLPIVEKETPDLEQCELVPFAAAVRAGVEAVMTAHVVYPTLDEDHPATMSRVVLSDWLRGRLGHKGLIVSDDMEMGAVRDRYPLAHQLDLACRATIDLFLCCKDPSLQVRAFEQLVHMQEADKRHDDLSILSNKRVMAARRRFLLDPTPAPPLAIVGGVSHRDLAMMVTARGEV